jgi:hypothetical protein
MKKIFTLMLAIAAFSAVAGEIKLLDKPTYEFSQVSNIRQEFAINASLNRAWVTLKFDEVGDGPVVYDERVQVEGLSYNSTTNEVLLDVEGTQIVCAKVKINFFGTNIKNTGKCTFAKKYYNVKVDNGYEVETIEKLKITLVY